MSPAKIAGVPLCFDLESFSIMPNFMVRGRTTVVALILILLAVKSAPAETKPLEFKEGDRIAWVGGAFVERDQMYGYLETLLTTAMPDKKLTFRNLGWSGDTVEGTARAVFGSPADGFQRLVKDMKDAKPTLIMVCYGANEAHAGEAGLASFKKNYVRLLDELAKATGARLALVAPHRHESVDPRLPDPNIYNSKLPAYVAAIKQIASEKQCALVDLSELVPDVSSRPGAPRLPRDVLTDNGIHFTQYGYWRSAPEIAKQLGVQRKQIDIVIDLEAKSSQATGAALADVEIAANKIRFTATSEHLPLAPSPREYEPVMPDKVALRLTVKGLAKDKQWTITCDGKDVILSGDYHLETGGLVLANAETAQVEELRQAIQRKNELWFHRHRPQNETYLFLFRKHEQGRNAVEIPQFDPLIEAQEQVIAQLARPKPHVYEIKQK
jgi:lysophospholipase L1-like esterase